MVRPIVVLESEAERLQRIDAENHGVSGCREDRARTVGGPLLRARFS
jgi:hypothetical protein